MIIEQASLEQEPAPPRWFLTGAGGWFGLTALYEYEQLFGPEALRNHVVAFASKARSIDFGSKYGPIGSHGLESMGQLPPPKGLLHLAFLTRDRAQELGQERYIDINREITAKVGELLTRYPTIPIITTSSGAAAALDGHPPELEMNPYGSLKQEEEALWHRQANTRMAVVFRVYAATGRFMAKPERFALGDFLMRALAGERIVVKATHPVVRTYVHVGTLMRLCWALLEQPIPQGFLSVDACTDQIELKELARQISILWNVGVISSSLEATASTDTSNTSDVYCGEPSPYLSLLARYKLQSPDLIGQIRDTAKGLNDMTALAKDAPTDLSRLL